MANKFSMDNPKLVSMYRGATQPLVIAHRGGSLEAPENTILAVQQSIIAGSDWQEIDVALSTDDVVMVFHDAALERTTDGEGLLADKSFQELRNLDAGRPSWTDSQEQVLRFFGASPKNFNGTSEACTIPTLSEVLDLPNGRLMVEIKRGARADILIDKTLELIREKNAFGRVAIGSFEPEVLDKVRMQAPDLPLIGIAETSQQLSGMLRLPLQVLAARIDLVPEALEAIATSLPIWAWTLYSAPMVQQAIDFGVQGLITDIPKTALTLLHTNPPDPEG
jgi:glycerophosphoryl diester phosphodiesterase